MRTPIRWFLLALPAIVAGLIVLVMLNWHRPTHVRIVLKANRTAFTVGGNEKTPFIAALGVHSVQIQQFAFVRFTPAVVTQLNDEMARQPVATLPQIGKKHEPIIVTPIKGRLLANVTVSAQPDGSFFLMDSLSISPSAYVDLETTPDGDLISHLRNQESSGRITSAKPLIITVDQCQISSLGSSPGADEQLTLQVNLAQNSSVEFASQPIALTMTFTTPPQKASDLFAQGSIPLSSIAFERLDGSGHTLSSLIDNNVGEISYPDYKTIEKVPVSSPDFLWLGELTEFSIQKIEYDPTTQSIAMIMQGVAGRIVSGSPNYPKDHRLTLYDTTWHDHKIAALVAVVIWVAGGTVGAYKLIQGK